MSATNTVRDAYEAVQERGSNLNTRIPEIDLQLRDTLSGLFPVDSMSATYYQKTHQDLQKILLDGPTLQADASNAKSIKHAEKKIQDAEIESEKQQATIEKNEQTIKQITGGNKYQYNNLSATDKTKLDTATDAIATAKEEIKKQEKILTERKQKREERKNKLKLIKDITTGGIYGSETKKRHNEFRNIDNMANYFDKTSEFSHKNVELGTDEPIINLDDLFAPSGGGYSINYHFLDKAGSAQKSNDITTDVFDFTGQKVEITIKGIKIDNDTKELSFENIAVEGENINYPLQVNNLTIRGILTDPASGRMFYHDKKLSLTLTEPNTSTRNTNYATRYANLESVMTIPTLQTQLDNIRNNNYETFEKEAFFKIIENDDIFKTMPDAQKDDLYRIMQGMPIIGGGALANIIPNPPVYADFRTRLLAYKTPQTFTNESDYRDRVRSNLPNIIQEYMTDTLKTHTDSSAVRTTIKKALLDYDNESLQANAMRFDRRIASNIRNLDPETHRVKPRWKLWARGEEQNYLSFFQHQNTSLEKQSVHDGKTEHTYDLSLSVAKGNNVSAIIQTGDGKELSFTGRSHTALMRSILRSPEIDSHHLRCHAAMSVAKGITKLAHENNIQLLSPMGGLRNRFMEMRMDGDKLVAESYRLNAGTRSKVNKQTIFDESLFQGKTNISQMTRATERLMESTNHTLNSAYRQRHKSRHTDFLQRPLLKKHRYGGLPNLWKKLSFDGESLEIGGQSYSVSCDNGLFEITGGALEKPLKGRNLGKLIAYKPELRGLEMKVLSSTNQKLIDMYRSHEKVAKHNYGIYDRTLNKTYIINANGDIGVVDIDRPNYEYARWRFMGSNSDYGRIPSSEMPHGMRILNDHEKASFLQNAELVGKTIRAMAKTHRARF